MQSPPAPAMDPASALAQAIGRILCAMLDAFFGDISGLAPRHPMVRAHARTLRHIERYVAALEAALRTPAQAPDDATPLTPEPRPDSVIPYPRAASKFRAARRPHTPHQSPATQPHREKPLDPLPASHAHIITI